MSEKVSMNKDLYELAILSIKYVEGTHKAVQTIDEILATEINPILKDKLESVRDELLSLSGKQINKVLEVFKEA